MDQIRWVILAGQYPPTAGGVSDYTRLAANALAAAGVEVHVIAPGLSGLTPEHESVHFHNISGPFNFRSLLQASAILKTIPHPYRLLVQYVPYSYGYKAMNLPFALWLFGRSFRDEIQVMWHEVAFPLRRGYPRRHQFLAMVQWAMAFFVARAGKIHYISVPMWKSWLQPMLKTGASMIWLPVFSNAPDSPDADKVAQIRHQIGNGRTIIGHFGTFGPDLCEDLSRIFPTLLNAPDRVALFIGRKGERFIKELLESHPELQERVRATGGLASADLVNHLAACDLMIQPYLDGVSSRRGSVMASMAIGLPIVTNRGVPTESIWSEMDAVAIVPTDEPQEYIRRAEELLRDPELRRGYRARSRALYEQYFSVQRTVEILLSND